VSVTNAAIRYKEVVSIPFLRWKSIVTNVKSVLTNGKLLLRFATASVIESLSGNPEICNFVLNDISNEITSGSNYLSLMLSGRQQRQQQSFSDDIYSALILEEAEKIYNKLTTELTNKVIAAAAAIK
jgi:hypothetical protein